MLATSTRSAIVAAPWFGTDWAPCALIDADLRISAINEALAAAVGRPAESLRDQPLFDAFPANPADSPGNVLNALDLALRSGQPVWLGYQRYDIPDPRDPARFIPKIWAAATTPVHDNGRVVGVVNHVQEIAAAHAPPPPVTARLDASLGECVELLRQAFPDTSHNQVFSVLAHSHRVVLDTVGGPDVERAVELARLRLEVRTGRPARPVPGNDGARG